jgi:cytochrome c5
MSDAHQVHESAIRTPKQLVAAVAAFLLITVIGIILLVTFVTSAKLPGAGSDGQTPEAIAARLRPVADAGFTFRDANAPKVLQAAEAVYTTVCAACHAAGVAGAPKFGDPASWSARIAQGYDTLVKHAIEGIRAMPAKGGNPDLDDVEVARAVVYMANHGGAKFKEPAVPAPGAAPAATTAATAPDAATAPAGTTPAAPAAPAVAAASAPAAPSPAPAPAPAAAPVAAAAATTVAAGAGKKLSEAACFVCHGAGIAGAPKFGDKGAWAARIAQGLDTLHTHAIKGFQGKAGVMPPKGGSAASDDEVKAAVDYMVAAAK